MVATFVFLLLSQEFEGVLSGTLFITDSPTTAEDLKFLINLLASPRRIPQILGPEHPYKSKFHVF